MDAVLSIRDSAGKSVAGGRTYTASTSNPKRFILEPGEYQISAREIRGDEKKATVTVTAGGAVEHFFDYE